MRMHNKCYLCKYKVLTMKLLNLYKNFPNEEAYENHFCTLREKNEQFINAASRNYAMVVCGKKNRSINERLKKSTIIPQTRMSKGARSEKRNE